MKKFSIVIICFLYFSFLFSAEVNINLYYQKPNIYNEYKDNIIIFDYANTNEYTVINIDGKLKELLIVELKPDKKGNLVESKVLKKYPNIENKKIIIRCPFDKKSLKIKWSYIPIENFSFAINTAIKKMYLNQEYEEHLIGEKGKFVNKKNINK